MEHNTKLKGKLELIWWVFTAIIIIAVMYPIYKNFKDYPFWTMNIIFIIVFITYARLIFLLKHSFIAYNFPIKLFLVFFSIPLTFFLISSFFEFQDFLDTEGQNALLQPEMLRAPLSGSESVYLSEFVKKEMLFFAVGSIITAIMMPFRMTQSIWRTRNRGTV